MKIIDVLLQKLPESYVDRIVSNMDDFNVAYQEEGTLASTELMTLFDWNQSREGYDFWNDVYLYLVGESELPQLPIDISYKPSSVIVMKDGMYVMNAGGSGIAIKYDIIMHELKNSNKRASEQVYAWLN
jgi:hypothetical protein